MPLVNIFIQLHSQKLFLCKPTLMTRILLYMLTVLICSVNFLFAQNKSLHVVKVSQAPKIDGKLDDAAWQNAPVADNFIINFPDFGKPASQRTEVKVIYDDEAIYIGAYLHDDPKLIRKQLTERDKEDRQDADNFSVAFDTYKDKQNAFEFLVTVSNVQSDVRISSQGQGNDGFDYNWDAVWDSRTSVVADGWIAEIKIPYSAIRFAKMDIQNWGANFSRYIRRLNETSYWNPVDPNQDGFVNQFGDLTGLQNLTPPLRLSLLPYVSTGYRSVPTNAGTINTFLHNGGMDVKYGVNESFTVDMTLIPDFGQVQSDNVILNLTPFEQQFEEHRPFFTEGTELFNKAGIFYSRRVGETPVKYYDVLQFATDSGYTILKNPSVTQLYNATKFSGRTKNGLGIGVFNAITAPMHAVLEKNGIDTTIETEPLSNYNVFVLDQSLKNRSSITFTNTNVIRNGHARDGNVSALDVSLFDKSNTYNLQMSGDYSIVNGDNPHNGFRTYFGFHKVSGKWQAGIFNDIKSEYYDPNDLGILFQTNEINTGGVIAYNQFTPNKTFNYRNYEISINYTNRYKPFSYATLEIDAEFLHVFKNFWDVSFETTIHPLWDNDYYDLRTPGRVLKKVPWTFVALRGSTDSRKKLYVNYLFGYANFSPQPDDPFTVYELGARYRFGPKFSLSVDVERQFDKGNIGFALFDPVTNDPIPGLRSITQVTSNIDAIYNFKARMNLNLRIRHYWSKVAYHQFYNVHEDGYYTWRDFIDGQNENFNAFNVDMFFTWDFRLGSRLIVAWKNALGPDATVDGIIHTKYIKNVSQIFNVPHSNEVSVKFVYYIDAQNFIKKKK